MNEKIIMNIYEEYAKDKGYRQFPKYEEAVTKMDLLIQSYSDRSAFDELEENSSEVAVTAEMQGFYNGFRCAMTCFLGDISIDAGKVMNAAI